MVPVYVVRTPIGHQQIVSIITNRCQSPCHCERNRSYYNMSNLSPEARQGLEKDLEFLLGFEDGCDGILNHLLTFENKTDLKEYLYQLLGHENATIANFIERLWNSKLGYHTDTKTVVSSSVERESNPLPCRSLEDMNRNDNEKIEINLLRNLNQSKDHRLPKSDNGSGSFIQENIQIKPNQQQNQQQQQQQQAKEQWKSDQEALKRGHQESLNRLKDKHNKKVDEPTHPVRKGKPENPCGCYGIRHRPLINCLFCGRIACELEGYNDCNFCGNPLVESDKYRQEKFKQDNVAWKQKELMVQYDREYARRTVVYDEQADYYSNSTSSWLTGKEREEESKKDESNRRVLHDRDLVMNLGI